jgi:O-acetyl-ADP-ribose deacetylase (regulator of RNase III)
VKAINYLKGDATLPQSKGDNIIAHICNDMGRWGSGFVVAVSKRWKEPEKAYRQWHQTGEKFTLGEIQVVQVTPELRVVNMIAQHKIKPYEETPIRYEAVEKCLVKLASVAKEMNAAVHMPRIGCGLAGGKWEKIEPLIIRQMCEKDVEVFVYDYDEHNPQ